MPEALTSLCIHQLFEAQVARSPEAIALVCGEQQLTYAAFNRRANQLAHHLRRSGAGPEVMVGICLERSVEMGVGILGILKAGAAYVPLDPTYPKDLLAYMLRNADVPVLVTSSGTAPKLPDHAARLVCLDTDWPAISEGDDQYSHAGGEWPSDQLAYVIYTSGSTGEPRGVMVTCANLCHYVRAIGPVLGITAHDVCLHTASFSFSSSVRQLIVPLCHGATVFIANSEQLRDPMRLLGAVRKHGITVMDLVPSFWRSCTNALLCLRPDDRTRLLDNQVRLILSASEPLVSDIPDTWRFRFNHGAELINMYGQTETTGIVCCYRIPPSREKRATVVPIGRPIANTQIHVLDQHLRPVPVGMPGELYIGGAGVSRGYLKRPALTVEKFIPSPFEGCFWARLYKTGDLGCSLADGEIRFLGRIDDQVKIRGHRVELTEIEAALSQHPNVHEAALVAREDVLGHKRLIAYVVFKDKATWPKALRRFLQKSLPDYMLPSAYIALDALPLTPTGKVDRRALQAPSRIHNQPRPEYAAPRDKLELQLTQMWEKLLGVHPIGIRENFFELGGDSLLAVSLFALIEQVIGRDLPLTTLFQGGTVAELADILRAQDCSTIWSSLVPIQSEGLRPPFFCVHDAGGHVLNYRDLARRLPSDQPFYGLQSRGLDPRQSIDVRIEDMAAHYIQEIRTIQPEGPYYLGGASFGGLVAFEMAQQLHAAGQKVAMLALLDTALDMAPRSYDQLLPAVALIHHKVWRLSQRIKLHADKLRRLRPQDDVVYLIRRINAVKRKIRSRMWQIGYTFYLPILHRVPRLLRNVKEANYHAAKQYFPESYPGRVTLFRASEQSVGRYPDPELGWWRLAGGGVDVHEVSGDHINIIVEPHVRDLAEALNACLVRAQSEPESSRLPDT